MMNQYRTAAVISCLKEPIVLVLLLGLAIRLALAPLATYTFDVTGWALIMQNIQSSNGLYDLAGYYYSPPWGYVLADVSELMDHVLGIDVYGDRAAEVLPIEWYGWYFNATATTPAFNFIVKLPMVVSDLIAGYLIYWIVMDMTNEKKKATLAFALWFLCPFVITVGCVGGQFDSLSVVFTLLTYIFLRRERYICAGAMFSLAFLTKLFPALLIFVFIAYILCRNKGKHNRIVTISKTAAGFLTVMIVILLPNIIEGNISDCFAFITSRATNGMGGNTGDIISSLTVVAYLAIAAISAVLALRLYKSGQNDLERRFLFFCTLTLTVLFLYPAAPQYILLLLPFLVIWYTVYDRGLKKPLILLMIGTTMFSVASNFTLLISVAEFTDLVSINSLMDLIDWYQSPVLGLSIMGWQYYSGGILQWISIVWIAYLLLKKWKASAKHTAEKGHLTETPAAFTMPDFKKITTRQRDYLLFGCAYTVACVCMFAVVRIFGIPSSVYDGYYPYTEAMLNGELPYKEMVYVYNEWHDWEYPPLAYFFLMIPRLISIGRGGYEAAFMGMTVIFFIIGLRCCETLSKETGQSRFKVMFVYTVLMMLMFEFLTDRFDIIPAVLTLVSFTLFIKKRYELSFVILGLGALVKLYPLIFIPVFWICLLMRKEYRRTVTSTVWMVIAVFLVLGLNMLAGIDPLSFLQYHTDRPLEIESLYASLLSFVDLFVDLNINVAFSYGSDNLVGASADSLNSIGLKLMIGMVILGYILYFASLYRNPEKAHDNSSLFSACTVTILNFILFCTVFSGQYVIWAIPPILVFLTFSKDKDGSRTVFWIFLIIEILTQINFAVNFGMRGEGEELSAFGIAVILSRNVLVLYLLCVSILLMWGKTAGKYLIPRSGIKIPEKEENNLSKYRKDTPSDEESRDIRRRNGFSRTPGTSGNLQTRYACGYLFSNVAGVFLCPLL